MKTLLLIIDLQKSFINKNTEQILPKIENLLNQKVFSNVIFTRFINSTDSIYYRNLNYKECISNESKEIQIDTRGYKIIDKNSYSALTQDLKDYTVKENISKIYLCGIDTECCILKTAFDLFENEYNVYILKDCCACMYGEERHNNALAILSRNIGKDKII